MGRDELFNNGSLYDWLQARLRRAVEEASTIPEDRVLSVPEADLLEELVERYRVEPPVLHLDRRYTPGAQDVRIDVSQDPVRDIRDRSKPFYVPGTRVEVRIPFEGDAELFRLRPSTFTHDLPFGRVEGQELVVWYEAPADSLDPQRFEQEINRNIQLIHNYLQWVERDCVEFNRQLEQQLEGAIRRRKEKVLQDRQLEAYLRIPVQRRPDPSPAFSVPVRPRRRPGTVQDTRSGGTKPFVPEPAVSPEDYAEILTVIRSWRDLVERLPKTFQTMRESVLRDILLVVLNNQFGPVGAEVFSRKGKTDIFLWHERGAVFIAECKIWEGPKAFREAVDQLLGYLVWRDTKSALIVVVRNRKVSAVQTRADQVLREHPNYKRRAPDVAGFPVYVLHHEGDWAREIHVALVLVAVPTDQGADRHPAGEDDEA
ncbi:MAG: hypothetical protein IMHGJWDQ_001473 [Candidatus Fervidibacter sp.]